MPDSRGNWTFGDFVGAGVGIAAAIGLGYVAHRIREDQIDTLLQASTEKGFLTIMEIVPPMDNDAWQDFQMRLQFRSQSSVKAGQMLELARCIVREENEVGDLLRYDFNQIRQVLPSLLRGKNLVEQLGFVTGLRTHAQRGNIFAKALLSELIQS